MKIKFSLSGETFLHKGKFGCNLTLTTEDGATSSAHIDPIYDSRAKAQKMLDAKMKEILKAFGKQGEVEIKSQKLLGAVK